MLLAIDVGNTNTVYGLFDGRKLVQSWRLNTVASRTADEHWSLLYTLAAARDLDLATGVDAVAIGSVVPPLTQTLAWMCEDWLCLQPLIVTVDLDLGLNVRVREPKRVGVDRLLNAVAARAAWGAPCIALDFGTATKFDVVDANGDFIGGAIAPGMATSADALVKGTAQLPRVDLTVPPQPIGDDTTSALQAGIVLGYLSLVEGMIERIRTALGANHVPVVATGGLAGLIMPLTSSIDHHDPWLTLLGLRLICERNQRRPRDS